MAGRNSHRPFVMIGDFNTGRNDFDIEGNGVPFYCSDQFASLHEEAGVSDLWRLRHGERRDWTWRSAKNGFRIDHAFGNRAFAERFPNFKCEINHEPRLAKLWLRLTAQLSAWLWKFFFRVTVLLLPMLNAQHGVEITHVSYPPENIQRFGFGLGARGH
jgi:hypothetical protein